MAEMCRRCERVYQKSRRVNEYRRYTKGKQSKIRDTT